VCLPETNARNDPAYSRLPFFQVEINTCNSLVQLVNKIVARRDDFSEEQIGADKARKARAPG